MMQREDVLRRYRQLRAIGTHHHSAALKLMGRTLVANTEEEMTLVFDLAIYTAKEGRSRAIDRYAKVAQLPPDSDERSMLEAMRHAQFSIWRVAGRFSKMAKVKLNLPLLRRRLRLRPDDRVLRASFAPRWPDQGQSFGGLRNRGFQRHVWPRRRSCLHRFANSQEHVLDHFWITWWTVQDRFDLRGDADPLQLSSCIPRSMPDGMPGNWNRGREIQHGSRGAGG
jgi:hypothetical protein